jgi:hypothetical protein
VEVVNEVEIRYWQVEVTLEYRADKWNLQLQDVGWNYLKSGVKERAYVIDSKTLEEVPASIPQPLNSDGTRKASGPPNILERRVHRQVPFNSYFGQPTQA